MGESRKHTDIVEYILIVQTNIRADNLKIKKKKNLNYNDNNLLCIFLLINVCNYTIVLILLGSLGVL